MPRPTDPNPAAPHIGVAVSAPTAEEAALVTSLQRGDEDAFTFVIRDYGRPLLATARRMLGNDEDANDALQETFLSAFQAIRSFEGKSRLGTWLHRIAVNTVLMKLRRRKRSCERSIDDLLPHFHSDGHHVEPPCPFSDAAIAALQSSESRELLWRGIDQLPPAYREVIVLRDIEGLSTEETALHLGITTNAIKIRLHRARQALRTLLTGVVEELSP